jgi:hypothetical protein
MDFFESWYFDAPPISLTVGPRGGGKSFLSALHTHLESIRHDNLGTRILGGSMAQSEQIYNALKGFRVGPELMRRLTKTHAEYYTGSDVSILAATSTSVRGPHVARLKLDEVDEIDDDIRDAAIGMNMARGGVAESAIMTSTHHNVGGPMDRLIEKARGGDFPLYTFCTFEVLQRCPDERSGPNLEKCPDCPLMPWCHSDRDDVEVSRGLPKAKRSSGHYSIGALIQKARLVSRRVFEADYLCSGPKVDGLWFKEFDAAACVTDDAEYDPRLPVGLGVDSGVTTGASWFQVDDRGPAPVVAVFADYLSEGRSARENAEAINRITGSRCEGRVDWGYTDPAGKARTPIGPTVLAEYEAVGLSLDPWPKPSPAESLNVIEGMLNPASGPPRLLIHPRCVDTIRAFQNYRRARRSGQWMDWPQDPQHPWEDIIDALRGAVYAVLDGPSLQSGGDPTRGHRG